MRQSTLNDLHPADEFRSPDQIKWRDDLYPRFEPDPVVVKQYADDLDVLSPIQINQHNEIIDGRHRLMAYQFQGIDQIPVEVIETDSDSELRRLDKIDLRPQALSLHLTVGDCVCARGPYC